MEFYFKNILIEREREMCIAKNVTRRYLVKVVFEQFIEMHLLISKAILTADTYVTGYR